MESRLSASALRRLVVAALFPAVSFSQAKRTTLSGVYTLEQAKRGKTVYASLCKSCHAAATHTGTAFAKWRGKTLADLYDFMSVKMPKNEPGSLSEDQYTDVMTYI